MDKLTREEWENAIESIAVEAGSSWLKDMHSKKWFEANEVGQKAVHDAVRDLLMKEYPYEEVTNKDMKALGATNALDWAKFVNRTGDDPRAIAERAEYDKYLPLLQGVAKEGTDWYNTDTQKLKYMAASEPFNFEYTQEGFKEFLDNLAKYQGVYDRGSILQEMKKAGWYLPMKLVYPKAMAAAEQAIANGEDPKNLPGLFALDAGTNVATWMAPSLNVVKSNPILTGAIDATLQGAAEAGRQGLGDAIGDVEADYSQAPIASLLGLTRPGMMGSAQTAMQQLTGPNARQFARGFASSTRAGNPVVGERAMLSKRIDYFNRKWNEMLKKESEDLIPVDVRGGVNMFVDPNKRVAMLEANMPAEFSEWAKIARKSDGSLDKDAILSFYDRMNPVSDVRYKNGITRTNETKQPGWHYSDLEYDIPSSGILSRLFGKNKPGQVNVYLGDKEYNAGKALVGSKFAELEGRTPWTRAGSILGTAVGDFGGRFEPTFKVNPFELDISTNPFGVFSEKDDYRDSQWYKRLSDESKAIVDAAFARKKSGK